jgi:hypothetical protein
MCMQLLAASVVLVLCMCDMVLFCVHCVCHSKHCTNTVKNKHQTVSQSLWVWFVLAAAALGVGTSADVANWLPSGRC